MDFTSLITAIDISTVTVALAAIAAIKIVPSFVLWAFDHVIMWFNPDFYKSDDVVYSDYEGENNYKTNPNDNIF